MNKIMQLDYNELREVVKDCFKEAIKEINQQPVHPKQPDRIGVADVMEITGMSKSLIYKLNMKGNIPCKKFGRRLIFSRKEIIQWMESHTIPKTSPELTSTSQLAKEARKRYTRKDIKRKGGS